MDAEGSTMTMLKHSPSIEWRGFVSQMIFLNARRYCNGLQVYNRFTGRIFTSRRLLKNISSQRDRNAAITYSCFVDYKQSILFSVENTYAKVKRKRCRNSRQLSSKLDAMKTELQQQQQHNITSAAVVHKLYWGLFP